PGAELEAAAVSHAICQYAPPAWQVRIRAAASCHLRGRRRGNRPRRAEREDAYESLEHQRSQPAVTENAVPLVMNADALFTHDASPRIPTIVVYIDHPSSTALAAT